MAECPSLNGRMTPRCTHLPPLPRMDPGGIRVSSCFPLRRRTPARLPPAARRLPVPRTTLLGQGEGASPWLSWALPWPLVVCVAPSGRPLTRRNSEEAPSGNRHVMSSDGTRYRFHQLNKISSKLQSESTRDKKGLKRTTPCLTTAEL